MFNTIETNVYANDNLVVGKKAIIRTDTNDCIGIVGKHYKVVEDKELLNHFKIITDKLHMKWQIKKYYEIRKGQKTITEIEFPSITKIINKKDKLKLRAHIINGYNGFTSAKLQFGFFRLVCENGMTVGSKDFSIGYRHVGKVNEKLIETFEKYTTEKIEKSINKIKRMAATRFKNTKEINTAIDNSSWLSMKYIDMVKDAYKIENMSPKLSHWKLFNAYTYVITHRMNINHENRLHLHLRLNKESLNWE